jgi:uncharacterized protein YndB with AHSA1/START domain
MDPLTPLPPPTSWAKAVALLIGLFMLLYTSACLVMNNYGAAFFAIPLFVGFASGVIYWPRPYIASMLALLGGLFLTIITLREGIICVLFSLPILLPLLLLGAFTGNVAVRHLKTRRAQRGGVALSVLLALSSQVASRYLDDPRQHPLHSAQAEVLVAAPPSAVFAALTQDELRIERRWPWFIRIGLPMPERMRVEQPGVDGSVRFDFDQGIAFARITAWTPNQELAYGVNRYEVHDLPFHITRLGRGPDYGFRRERVEDWLTLEGTRWTLEAVAGSTLLRRRVVWRRHLAPDFYFGWLQQSVMERGQRRLLELVRTRVETTRSSPVNRLALR